MTALDMTPRIGDRLGNGRFELLAKLGEGGMSLVFRARDHACRRDVALKLLQPRYVGRPDREQRLLNEGEYLRRLQGQPWIVEFVDAGRFDELGGWPWLATEVLEGRTLNWLFLAAKLEWAVVLTIIRQVAESLDACHRCGIVNRDVTPTNVMVVDPGTHAIKLFDFSHAGSVDAPRVAAGMPGRLTGEFDAPGSVGYMSPEQACKAPPDPTMDVFGFGALVYELVTHETPYAGVGDRDAFILAQSQGSLEPLRLHAWAYSVPEALGELVQACTQPSLARRPSMREVIERLDQLAGTAPVDMRDEGDAGTMTRAKPWWWIGGSLGVIVLLGLSAIAWPDRSTEPEVEVAEVEPEPPVPAASHVESPAPVEITKTDPSRVEHEPTTPREKPPTQDKPEANTRSPKPPAAPSCDSVEAEAKAAATARDWTRVLALTQRRECWPSQLRRTRIEVDAHLNLGQWAECVRIGGSSEDPKIQALVATCKGSR